MGSADARDVGATERTWDGTRLSTTEGLLLAITVRDALGEADSTELGLFDGTKEEVDVGCLLSIIVGDNVGNDESREGSGLATADGTALPTEEIFALLSTDGLIDIVSLSVGLVSNEGV